MASARSLAQHALLALKRGRQTRLRAALEGAQLDRRDQAFASELAHGVLRRERLLDHVLLGFAHRGLPKQPALLTALRLGVYQLLFVPGMPAHAAVHETVALIRENKGFANALLRRVAGAVADRAADPARPREELALGERRCFELAAPLPEDEVARLALQHSLPDWLAQRCCEQHGLDGLRQIAAAASCQPGVFLRAVGDVDALVSDLQAEEVQVERAAGAGLLRWSGGAAPFRTRPFQEGRFVVQDPTAAAVAAAVPCAAGDVVIDLCAAPGTKTTLLAERVQPGGRVLAYDPDASRRERVVENVTRLGFGGVVGVVSDPAALEPAGSVLADVPCSNTGVLGRRVEVRGRLQPEVFEQLAVVQRQILERAFALTEPGGHLVYSTCSVDREENEDVVAAMLGAHPDLELLEQVTTLPAAGEHDGGFYAVLRRGGLTRAAAARAGHRAAIG